MRFIGLDLGSTYTKAALFHDNMIEESLSVPTPLPISTGVRYEINAEEYWQQVLSLLEKLMTPTVEGIFISTQMHGCILTDEHFNPQSPYISWRDSLGAIWLDRFREQYGLSAVLPSGVPFKTNLALCALLARREEGENLPENALFCTLGGYIIGRLTGKHVCHMTNAAPSGMADVRNGIWNRDLIRHTGLDILTFPDIRTDISVCGYWHGIPVFPDLGDQQVCAFGAKLVPERTLHISIGTAGLIGILSTEWGNGQYENRPWISPGLYLRTVSGLPGGRHLTAFAQNLLEIMQDITGQTLNINNILDYLSLCRGEPAPDSNSPWKLPAADAHTFIQNLYESFAFAYDNAAQQFSIPVKELSFSGGCAAKNEALRQRVITHFGQPVVAGDHDVWCGIHRIADSV